jgi:protein-disulfide isomerase
VAWPAITSYRTGMTESSKFGGSKLWIIVLGALLLVGIGGAFVWRQATQLLVKDYILENPEILMQAMQNLQKKETANRLASAGGAISKPFAGAVHGAQTADITIVEFTDYNCGYCRKSVEDVARLIENDKKLRVVFRELPILSPTSRDAARWALAAANQGKHKAFHDAMFAGEPPSDASIRVAAQAAGLDMTRAEADANSAEIAAEIDGNLAMMQQVGFTGTPTFVIGDQIIEGALGYEALKGAVAKARKG